MSSICLITALPAEARPLISHFGLQALEHRHLRLYTGKRAYLLQCGIGKLNAAAATAAMLESLPDVKAIINVGITGSLQPIGQTLIAHAVEDQSTAKQWFPHLPPVHRLPETTSVRVLTVDQPSSEYTADTAFDMEAAGIVSAAIKVIDLAFIHCIKVVSDNAESGIESISAKSAAANMNNAIATIENLMAALPFDNLPLNTSVAQLSASLTQHTHYTTTERHNLHQLLHRYNALYGELPTEQSLLSHRSAKAIRESLAAKIDSAPVRY